MRRAPAYSGVLNCIKVSQSFMSCGAPSLVAMEAREGQDNGWCCKDEKGLWAKHWIDLGGNSSRLNQEARLLFGLCGYCIVLYCI